MAKLHALRAAANRSLWFATETQATAVQRRRGAATAAVDVNSAGTALSCQQKQPSAKMCLSLPYCLQRPAAKEVGRVASGKVTLRMAARSSWDVEGVTSLSALALASRSLKTSAQQKEAAVIPVTKAGGKSLGLLPADTVLPTRCDSPPFSFSSGETKTTNTGKKMPPHEVPFRDGSDPSAAQLQPLHKPAAGEAYKRIMVALGFSDEKQRVVVLERSGRLVVVSRLSMAQMLKRLLEHGIDAESIIRSPGVFSYTCQDFRLAVAKLVLARKPVTPAAIEALLAADPQLVDCEGGYWSWRWHGQSLDTLRQKLADEMGVTVHELDHITTCREYETSNILDKLYLLKQEGVHASPTDYYLHHYVFSNCIEKIAAALLALRKASISPITLLHLFSMARYNRITNNTASHLNAAIHAMLATIFQCDEKTIAAAAIPLRPLYSVGAQELHRRLSLLRSMGAQPSDVLRVPLVLAFEEADMRRAAARLETLSAEKREVLCSDKVRLLNALLYFADKADALHMLRDPKLRPRQKK